jgi:hypothetical protein
MILIRRLYEFGQSLKEGAISSFTSVIQYVILEFAKCILNVSMKPDAGSASAIGPFSAPDYWENSAAFGQSAATPFPANT